MTTSTRPGVRPWSADLLATGALALYSLSAALGFARVFADWSFLDELVPIILVGHGVGLLTRRVRLRAWVAIPVTLGAVVWLLAVLFYPDTLTLGLPTTETWELFRLEMTAVRAPGPASMAARMPAPPAPTMTMSNWWWCTPSTIVDSALAVWGFT